MFLQNVISVCKFPVDSNPALTISEISAWSHLQDLHLPEVDGEVLMSKGVDKPEALWVMDERHGNAEELHAVRSILG